MQDLNHCEMLIAKAFRFNSLYIPGNENMTPSEVFSAIILHRYNERHSGRRHYVEIENTLEQIKAQMELVSYLGYQEDWDNELNRFFKEQLIDPLQRNGDANEISRIELLSIFSMAYLFHREIRSFEILIFVLTIIICRISKKCSLDAAFILAHVFVLEAIMRNNTFHRFIKALKFLVDEVPSRAKHLQLCYYRKERGETFLIYGNKKKFTTRNLKVAVFRARRYFTNLTPTSVDEFILWLYRIIKANRLFVNLKTGLGILNTKQRVYNLIKFFNLKYSLQYIVSFSNVKSPSLEMNFNEDDGFIETIIDLDQWVRLNDDTSDEKLRKYFYSENPVGYIPLLHKLKFKFLQDIYSCDEENNIVVPFAKLSEYAEWKTIISTQTQEDSLPVYLSNNNIKLFSLYTLPLGVIWEFGIAVEKNGAVVFINLLSLDCIIENEVYTLDCDILRTLDICRPEETPRQDVGGMVNAKLSAYISDFKISNLNLEFIKFFSDGDEENHYENYFAEIVNTSLQAVIFMAILTTELKIHFLFGFLFRHLSPEILSMIQQNVKLQKGKKLVNRFANCEILVESNFGMKILEFYQNRQEAVEYLKTINLQSFVEKLDENGNNLVDHYDILCDSFYDYYQEAKMDKTTLLGTPSVFIKKYNGLALRALLWEHLKLI